MELDTGEVRLLAKCVPLLREMMGGSKSPFDNGQRDPEAVELDEIELLRVLDRIESEV